MRILLACLFVAQPLLGLAQTSDLYTDARTGTLNDRYALGYFLAPRADLLAQGNAFLVPQWLPGSLQLLGNSKPLEAPLKYNIYNLEVWAKRPAGDSVTVPLARIQEFSLGGRRFVCYPAATLPPDVGGGCGEVLGQGTATQLLKFERKTLEKRAAVSGSYATTTATEPVLEVHTRYYMRWLADGHLVALKLRRASLEQALATQPVALAALRTRKGSLSSEAELAAALLAVDPLLVPAKH